MAQLITKYIGDNQVNDLKFRARNNQFLRGRNAAGSGDVDILKVNASDEIEFASLPIASGTPSSGTQLVNKDYVDSVAAGLRDPKDAVRVVAAANVDIATGTLLTIDGVTLVAGDRVLLIGQTDASENGIYVAGTGAWSRSPDANSSPEVTSGLYTWAVEGTVYARTGFLLQTVDPIVLGTTNLTFVQIPLSTSYTAGDGLSLTGSEFAVNLATLSGLEFNSAQLRVKVSGAVAVKDRTIVRNGSGEIEGLKAAKTVFTLNSTDITNQYVDLPHVAADSSVALTPDGGPLQVEGTDYTLNYTGGSGPSTRITFAGDLATGGAAALISGDVIRVSTLFL